MTRPALRPSFRLALIAFGALCFLYALICLGHWMKYKRTDSVIGVDYVAYKDHGEIKYDTNRIRMIGTRPVLTVGFMRFSGSHGGVVLPERFLPASAKPGDHVTVLYREEWGLAADSAVIYSFDLIWRGPLRAALVGTVFICLGLWYRSRHKYLSKADAHETV
jgi:hypothetical protein